MMSDELASRQWPPREPSADSIAALHALLRAALKAQREAIETVGSFPIWRNGKVVYVTEVQFSEEDINRVEQEEAQAREKALQTRASGMQPVPASD